ncbi:hypothetical protein LSH36_13g26052 [Paralvinella palmiformis]|uniref:Phosphatidylcholine transfer protein n=1 Tax=Paralvinella palmiformis TaxID=53620 RepID=A0AAD9KDB7_9ANNE|nr:hypothetical protein LSH36_13g26052 [Paralvinella palmiformis]
MGLFKSDNKMFTDEDFRFACRELDTPDTSDWEFFVESHNIKIYRQYNQNSGLYTYKVYGDLDVSPDLCATVYMDYEYRCKWDDYVSELCPIKDGEKDGVYWRVKYPFPLSHRDSSALTFVSQYCYLTELREFDINNKHVWVILCRSEQFSCMPEKSGVIRVDDYEQSLALTYNKNGGTQAYMYYYDDPKGMIPTWLINWAAKIGVPGFLEQMVKACKGYNEYKESLPT